MMLRGRARIAVLLLGLLAFLPSCPSSRQETTYTRLSGEVFHTYFSIQYDLEENYQQEDGSVIIPEVLRPYMKCHILRPSE